MTAPLHLQKDGLPIGLQYIDPYADETTLIRLAGHLERVQPPFVKYRTYSHWVTGSSIASDVLS